VRERLHENEFLAPDQLAKTYQLGPVRAPDLGGPSTATTPPRSSAGRDGFLAIAQPERKFDGMEPGLARTGTIFIGCVASTGRI